MTTEAADPDLEAVGRLTAAFAAELVDIDPAAAVPWPTMPSVVDLVAHVGSVHRWVAEVVRTRHPAAEPTVPAMAWGSRQAWFEEGSQDLLQVLAAVPAWAPCWVIGGQTGTVAFWRRRMVFENVKHLIDLRAAGGGRWSAAPELTAEHYADGIAELLTEFLPRSRPTLPPLPGTAVLTATDVGRAWTIGTEWTVHENAAAPPAAVEVRAGAADLALMLWERADPLRASASNRFDVRGDRATAAALLAAAIHPW